MNVGVDPQYQAKLQEKSTAAIEIELAEQKAKQLEKQLEQEKAQTEIDLEKARRASLVAEEEARVFEQSVEAYELKRLELMKDLLGNGDKVYFIPEGADITLFLGGDSSGFIK
jgi:molybdopterin converting factor small subunit